MTSVRCVKSVVGSTLVPLVYIVCIRLCSWGCLVRDHKRTIWRRFCGASLSCALFGFGASYWKNEELSYAQFFGFRVPGLLPALALPLCLTIFLYLGPIVLDVVNGCWKTEWRCLQRPDLVALRNLVLAPLTEEFAFRCCILPLWQNCLSARASLFIVPLFFSMGHCHHVVEQRRLGYSWKASIRICAFQALYTYIFGLYASFLYLRTGHFVASFICHSFCNRMGLPECEAVFGLQRYKRYVVCTAFVLGFLTWFFLLIPMTEPRIYRNYLAPYLF